MARWFDRALVLALGVGSVHGPIQARAQVVRERDVTITGPRGNSLQRDFKPAVFDAHETQVILQRSLDL